MIVPSSDRYDPNKAIYLKKNLAVTSEPYENHHWIHHCVLWENPVRFLLWTKPIISRNLQIFYRINWAFTTLKWSISWNREVCSASAKGASIMVSKKLTKFYNQCKLGSCMQIKTWKLRNCIFFVSTFFIEQHYKDNVSLTLRFLVTSTTKQCCCYLQAWNLLQVLHGRDHKMLAMKFQNIGPAWKMHIFVYLGYEMIGIVLK